MRHLTILLTLFFILFQNQSQAQDWRDYVKNTNFEKYKAAKKDFEYFCLP